MNIDCRSQPTTPERNRAHAREEDHIQQAQISPDGLQVPASVPPQALAGPSNVLPTISYRGMGQWARWGQRGTTTARGGAPGTRVSGVRGYLIILINALTNS